jgi:GntR family transcriptional repressor for pyruvate dehydrogenase complex
MAINDTNDNSNYALKRIRSLLDPVTLGPDRKLPTERALCEMLYVSRRSVRRALAVLEAEGHIWRRQGSGTFAGPAPVQIPWSLEAVAKQSSYMEVMELRLRLEPQFAALAASRATPADVERLRTLIQHISTSHDADERELWDSSLHRTVAEIAGNRLYLAIFDLVDRVRQEADWVEMRERARSANTNKLYRTQHDAVVDAIAAGDAAGAATAMQTHLLALQENLGRLTVPETADVS